MRLIGGSALVVCALAACYSANPAVGLPCSALFECPTDQMCDIAAAQGPTCVSSLASEVDAGSDGAMTDAAIDASTDGSIDGPPGVAPPNDKPAGAISVDAGGMFSFDLSNATGDSAPACASSGGPDVFYTLTLNVAEVIYLDTLASTAGDSVISIRAGACTAVGVAEGCVDNSCGSAQAQGAWNLAAGTHCIVIDQVGPGTAGALRVIRGGRAGDPLAGTTGSVTGNTCSDDDSNSSSCNCGGGEKDHHYFFATCPGMRAVTLDTCNGSGYDTVIDIRNAANVELECNDDDPCGGSEATETITGPGLFWGVMDGCSDCGPYTMHYSL